MSPLNLHSGSIPKDPDALVRNVADAIEGDALLELVRELCQGERLAGNAEEARAFDVIASSLTQAGLRVRRFNHKALVSLPGAASVSIDGRAFPAITHSFSVATGDRPVSSTCVEDIGSGPPAPGQLAGKISLADGVAMSGLVARNERAGAIAQIFICETHPHEMCISSIWGNPTAEELAQYPRVPVVSVGAQVGEEIRRAAAQHRTVEIRTEVDTRWRDIPLLTADLCPEGIDDLAASETPYVLLSGHVDSWHLGAMDNGSANAAMVMIGQTLARHRSHLLRGLRLAFWSGHSQARYAGSAWYADAFRDEIERLCIAHVNVDLIGGRGASILTNGACMPATFQCGAQAVLDESGQQFRGSRLGRGGDQSFVQLGVPSLFMTLSEQPPSEALTARIFGGLLPGTKTGGFGWWWHTTEDTIDKLDPANLARDTRVYARAILSLTCASHLPLDLVAQACSLRDEVQAIAQQAAPHMDLSGTVALAERAVSACGALDQDSRSSVGQSNEQVRQFLRVLAPLVELTYSACGRFAHDHVTQPLVPLLAPARRLDRLAEPVREATLVALRRSANYVNSRLRECIEAASSAMSPQCALRGARNHDQAAAG